MASNQTTPSPLTTVSASISPALLDETQTAAYIRLATSTLRNMRCADAKRQAAGQRPTGPRWIRIGRSIRYRITDLDRWIENISSKGAGEDAA